MKHSSARSSSMLSQSWVGECQEFKRIKICNLAVCGYVIFVFYDFSQLTQVIWEDSVCATIVEVFIIFSGLNVENCQTVKTSRGVEFRNALRSKILLPCPT